MLTWIIIVFVHAGVTCANIATNKPADQSTTEHPYYIASKAVDGFKDWPNCSHTLALGEKTAWWRVDFQDIYTITSVKITPRNWLYIGGSDGGGQRLAGYSIHVSRDNTSDPLERASLCYNYSASALPDVSKDQVSPCDAPISGRYVIIYNERKDGQTYPQGWSSNAVLELCEVEVSVQECPVNCQSCPCTTCRSGWYGQTCESSCPNCGADGSCKKTTGYCNAQSCKVGFYGNKCDQLCSQACRGDGSCDKQSGDCTSKSCKVGYYGSKCTNECSNQCATSTCNFDSGYCDKCHQDDLFGATCNETCPSKCLSCSDEYNCHSCQHGWYGKSCEINCPHCGGNGACDKTTGTCQSVSCVIGYFNEYCNKTCPNTCGGDGSCNFTSGSCYSCSDGQHGVICERKCFIGCNKCNSTTCFECYSGLFGSWCTSKCPGCGDEGSCSMGNGTCISTTCKAGFYGGPGYCNKTCLASCGGDGSCDINSGVCLRGCKYGFAGSTCTLICPRNCGGDRSCDQLNTSCSHGCAPGWFGSHCNVTCPTNCGRDGSCYEGICSFGCKTGWQGKNCSSVHLSQNSDSSSIGAVAGGGLAGLGVLIITLVLIVLVLIRSKKKKEKRGRGRSQEYVTKMFTDASNDGTTYTVIQNKEQISGNPTHMVGKEKSVSYSSYENKLTNPENTDKMYYEIPVTELN